MAACKVWDIVAVPFPYINRPVQQRRPALVVAVRDTSTGPNLLWVLMITSAGNRGWSGDVTISDLAIAGLPAASVVRTAKIATIEANDARRLGHLPPTDRSQVAARLRDTVVAALA